MGLCSVTKQNMQNTQLHLQLGQVTCFDQRNVGGRDSVPILNSLRGIACILYHENNIPHRVALPLTWLWE